MYSETELKDMLQLAEEKSASGRSQLFEKIADVFVDQFGDLSDQQKALMVDILCTLIEKVESRLKMRLSREVSHMLGVPEDLVVRLANDEITVAEPVLMYSKILQDKDLIKVIYNRSVEHQLAIAKRQYISPAVSNAIVEVGDESIITELLNNKSAEIAEKTMTYIVSQSKRVDSYRYPLVRREDLPIKLVSQLYWWVADELKAEIVKSFKVDEEGLEVALEKVVRDEINETKSLQGPPPEEDLVRVLAKQGVLKSDFLIKVLRHGEISLFSAILARFLKIDPTKARIIIFEGSPEAIVVAFKVLDFSPKEFEEVFGYLLRHLPAKQSYRDKTFDKILQAYTKMTQEKALKYLKDFIKDPDSVMSFDKGV